MTTYRRAYALHPSLKRPAPRTVSVEALQPMTPYELLLRAHAHNTDRLFGLAHPAPIEADARIICRDCGEALREDAVHWLDETTALCEPCYDDLEDWSHEQDAGDTAYDLWRDDA